MLKNVQQLFLGIAEVQLDASIELFYGCVPVWMVLYISLCVDGINTVSRLL